MLMNIGVGSALAVNLPTIVGPAEEVREATNVTTAAPTRKNALDQARHLAITPPWWGRHFLLNGSKLHQMSEKAAARRSSGEDPTQSASEAILMLVDNSSRFLPLGFLLLGGGAIVAVWGLLPAILAETRVGIRAIMALSPAARRATSLRHGRTTDKLFRFLRYAGNVMLGAVCLAVVLMLLTLVPAWERHITWFVANPFWERDVAPTLVRLLGLVVVAVLFSHGWFRGLALGLRSALDVGLDVVNWLRASPRDATPRARIVTRLTAMLQHVQRWKDPMTGCGYDALVILAHSQGSMIVIETLRYWKRRAALDQPGGAERSQPLSRYFRDGAGSLPISLFTMGNPLRQLYCQRFAHLYGWAGMPIARREGTANDAIPDNEMRMVDEESATVETELPDVDEAGLYRWWNAYRSGDYVGRSLWRDSRPLDTDAGGQARFEPAEHPPPATGRTADFCLGAGAHLRYWDETAPLVSQSLDRLVATA
jgi:hypothetical protein